MMANTSLTSRLSEILVDLNSSHRAERLPSALFDRLLSSISDVPKSEVNELHFENHFTEDFDADSEYHLRLVLRLFGILWEPDRHENICRIFSSTLAEKAAARPNIASAWLRSCKLLSKDFESRQWLYSSGCVTHVLMLLKHENMYVCRNSAEVISSLLSFYSNETEQIKDILTVLLGNLLQYSTPKEKLTRHSSTHENTALESAKLIVDFTEKLYREGMDSLAVRNGFKIELSIEEAKFLLHLAENQKRLQDCCIAVFCTFFSNSDLVEIPVSMRAKVALRKIKLASFLKTTCSTSDWTMALSPLQNLMSARVNGTYIVGVANFIKTCSYPCVDENQLLTTVLDVISAMESPEFDSTLEGPCLQFICNSSRLLGQAFNDEITDKLMKLFETSFQDGNINESNLIEFISHLSIVFSNILTTNHATDKTWRHLTTFVKDLIEVEGIPYDKCSSRTRLACTEGMLKICQSVDVGQQTFKACCPSREFVDNLILWATSAAVILNKQSSSDFNFEDVIAAYGHASRFNVLTHLILMANVGGDKKFMGQILETIPVKSLTNIILLGFPDMKRAACTFLFTVAHVSDEHHSPASETLLNLYKQLSDETDHSVTTILSSWNSDCKFHQDLNCEMLKDIREQSFSKKIHGSYKAFTPLEVALRICDDVLAFLNSADDTPCVVIGAPGNGDIDVIDCEES